MRRTQRFGVNVLARRNEGFARQASRPGADRFAGVDWELGPGGVPLLTDALATLECDTVAEHPPAITGSSSGKSRTSAFRRSRIPSCSSSARSVGSGPPGDKFVRGRTWNKTN